MSQLDIVLADMEEALALLDELGIKQGSLKERILQLIDEKEPEYDVEGTGRPIITKEVFLSKFNHRGAWRGELEKLWIRLSTSGGYGDDVLLGYQFSRFVTIIWGERIGLDKREKRRLANLRYF